VGQSKTLTAQFFQRNVSIKDEFRKAKGKLPIKHARVNNLQDVSVDIPVGVLTVIAGVAGSGKRSLINAALLQQHQGAVVIDQAPIGVSSRSNPATYTGIRNQDRGRRLLGRPARPARAGEVARPPLQAHEPEIAEALDGRYRPEHLTELRLCLALWAKYQERSLNSTR
jgi:excinuclease UvrABC ATPase subunit